MKNQKFWKLVKKCNWKKDCSYERIEKEIKNGKIFKDINELNDFREHFYNLKHFIYVVCFDKTSIVGGDDSYSDLLEHIIGLGEKKYMKILKNPKKINKYTDFKEAFGYSFQNIEKIN